MYYKNLIRYNDPILLGLYIKDKICEIITLRDLELILQYGTLSSINSCYQLWNMKSNVKLELYRRTGIITFNAKNLKYIIERTSEDEFMNILKTKFISCISILENLVDKRWDKVIKHISQYRITYEVSDVNIMEKLQYAMRISPDIHVSLRTVETYDTIRTTENLYNILNHEDGSNITVPLAHNISHYKTMLNNWKNIKAKPICTNGHNNKYIHHILFLLILGAKVRCVNITYNYVLNLGVMDYLAYKYPNAIYKLWITFPNNHTVRRICSIYYSSYLDRDKVDRYCKRYSRMHVIRTDKFSDITIV